jgi:hypothetical protein
MPGRAEAMRTPRAAAVAGILFGVLLSTALVLLRMSVPQDPDSAGDWLADGSKRRTVLFALNLLPFAGISFLWFIGVVRSRIGAAEDRLFSTVFLGSGLLFVAMLFVAGAVSGGLVLPPDEGVSEDLWPYGRRVAFSLLSVYSMRMAAVFTISTTTIATRLHLAPRWLSVWGFATGGLLLFTIGLVPWVELVFPLWVLVFSTHILVVSFRPGTAAAASAATTPTASD